ncbi:MAG: Fic family protein [Phycisphaerales bacterium]
MSWNWQQSDWPYFEWDTAILRQAEQRYIQGSGVLLGTVKHMNAADQDRLLVEAMSDEALTTSRIEGEILDRESVQSSIRRELGLGGTVESRRPAERGIGELMVDLYRRYALALDESTLHAWHRLIAEGRTDLRDVGRYRTHPEAMQVVSGPLGRPRVHFEAPPSAKVPGEMLRFVEWFNQSAPGEGRGLPALTRAGLAHLYFESIHPYEDGNGRIGRAISEKALAQGVDRPALVALSTTILTRRTEYYKELAAASRHNQVSGWLRWFGGVCLEAQQRALAQVDFLVEKAKLLDRLRGHLNDRQEAALLRMFREGPEGFKGGLSARNYVSITKASSATATRDLTELVELGALTRTGERRYTRYHLAVPLRPVGRVVIDDTGRVIEQA